MQQVKRAWKATYNYFDKLEDRVRFRLSRYPLLYAVIGAIGVALLWKGVDDLAASVGLSGFTAFALGLAIMLVTGLLVSFFIGDSIILSGFLREKKVTEKTEAEVMEEEAKMTHMESELKHIERELDNLRKHSQSPHIRL